MLKTIVTFQDMFWSRKRTHLTDPGRKLNVGNRVTVCHQTSGVINQTSTAHSHSTFNKPTHSSTSTADSHGNITKPTHSSTSTANANHDNSSRSVNPNHQIMLPPSGAAYRIEETNQKIDPDTIMLVYCSACLTYFTTESIYSRHILRCNNEISMVRCRKCFVLFETREELLKHVFKQGDTGCWIISKCFVSYKELEQLNCYGKVIGDITLYRTLNVSTCGKRKIDEVCDNSTYDSRSREQTKELCVIEINRNPEPIQQQTVNESMCNAPAKSGASGRCGQGVGNAEVEPYRNPASIQLQTVNKNMSSPPAKSGASGGCEQGKGSAVIERHRNPESGQPQTVKEDMCNRPAKSGASGRCGQSVGSAVIEHHRNPESGQPQTVKEDTCNRPAKSGASGGCRQGVGSVAGRSAPPKSSNLIPLRRVALLGHSYISQLFIGRPQIQPSFCLGLFSTADARVATIRNERVWRDLLEYSPDLTFIIMGGNDICVRTDIRQLAEGIESLAREVEEKTGGYCYIVGLETRTRCKKMTPEAIKKVKNGVNCWLRKRLKFARERFMSMEMSVHDLKDGIHMRSEGNLRLLHLLMGTAEAYLENMNANA